MLRVLQSGGSLIASIIAQSCASKPRMGRWQSARWIHHPTFEFYRRYLNLRALRRWTLDPALLSEFDFLGAELGRCRRAARAAWSRCSPIPTATSLFCSHR